MISVVGWCFGDMSERGAHYGPFSRGLPLVVTVLSHAGGETEELRCQFKLATSSILLVLYLLYLHYGVQTIQMVWTGMRWHVPLSAHSGFPDAEIELSFYILGSKGHA
jgi:hypothetical protein